MLKIDHIVKHFGNITALNNVSLCVNDNEFFGLLGPNGAGKSTMMNIIAGLLTPDNGNILIDEMLMSPVNINLRTKIGYIPQDIGLFLELSAYTNLKIFGGLYKISGKELEIKIDEVLELVQLKDRKRDRINEFSGGMKRRINLAAGLLHDPQILLCDEPTVGVDPQSRNAIFDMLQYLNKQGKTIIYTTHYMEEAERLCSNLAVIDKGEIIAHGSLLELLNMIEQKDTIKIQKNRETATMVGKFNTLGKLYDSDFYFEILPAGEFSSLSRIFAQLEEMKVPSQFIEVSRATLEDVFLNLTGRSLRD